MSNLKTGIVVILFLITSSSAFAQNLVSFESDKGKYGFKDINGKVIVSPIYTYVNDFREGLAAVYKGGEWDENAGQYLGGKWGFINNKGIEVILPIYDCVSDFNEGYACVVKGGVWSPFLNGEWGFINKTGNVVIPLQFDKIAYFKDGIAEVSKEGKVYHIDKSGIAVVKPQEPIQSLDTTLIIVDDVYPKHINGGTLEELTFIRDNLQAKYKDQLANSRSRSYVEIIVGTDGKVRDAKILRGVNQDADNDLLRVVKMLEYIPEVRNGRKLEVKFTLTYIW
jgi:hypothetical protein